MPAARQRQCGAFARETLRCGFTVISGLALASDAAAHRGGLAGASSFSLAVVGIRSRHRISGAQSRSRTSTGGARAAGSEFSARHAALFGKFPRRNRLISGLARGCLIVEKPALQGGSLITARYALEQGREVFAIPGSIHSPLSKVVIF